MLEGGDAQNVRSTSSLLRRRLSRIYWLLNNPGKILGVFRDIFRNYALNAIGGFRNSVSVVGILWFRFFGGEARHLRSVLHVSIISHKQYMLSRLLRRRGINSSFLALNTSEDSRLGIGCDFSIPIQMGGIRRKLYSLWLLWFVMARYDVIHYHFNSFLFEDAHDLYCLKKIGKKIVIHFRGCELRCRSINMRKNPDLNVCQDCDYPTGACDNAHQSAMIGFARQYGDMFFVTTPDLLDFFETAEHMPFTAPVEFDFDSIPPLPKPEGVFRVVTSSNHPGLDGVPAIRAAVQRLQSEGHALELFEVIRQPYREAIAAYKSADVFAGKLLMGYYNNANIETLMLGVPNISYIRPEYMGTVPDSPIIIATPDTFYDTLKEWLGKPEELKALGALGPGFVTRYHDPNMIIDRMIERYSDLISRRNSP